MDSIISCLQIDGTALHRDIGLTVNRIFGSARHIKGAVPGNRKIRLCVDSRLILLRTAPEIRDRILAAVLQYQSNRAAALKQQRCIGRVADLEAVENQGDLRAFLCIHQELSFLKGSAQQIGSGFPDAHLSVFRNRTVACYNNAVTARRNLRCALGVRKR